MTTCYLEENMEFFFSKENFLAQNRKRDKSHGGLPREGHAVSADSNSNEILSEQSK